MSTFTVTADIENESALNLADKIRFELEAFQKAPAPIASLKPQNIKRLMDDQRYVTKKYNAFEAELKRLETQGQIELSAHWNNLHPFQLRLKRISEALQVSEAFQALEQRIQAEIAEVKEASLALAKQFLPNHLPKFEAGLEQFMDRCDEVADQLDRYESQGFKIIELEPHYNQWMAMVERFGDILDTQIEALRLPQAQA